MKHTPGPWTFAFVEPDSQSDGYPPMYRVHGSDSSYEATLCELWSGEHDNEANARLIAAAPDLLMACRRAKVLLEAAQTLGMHLDEDKRCILSDAQAAIAKATQ